MVLGPNGAGKTSLLRACAGLLPITAGEAVVLGHDLTADRTGVRRQVGLLGHAAPLYDELTAAENVRFAVRAAGKRGRARPNRRSSGSGSWAACGARPSAGCRPASVAGSPWPCLVARAPELWLLDEPHAGLDAAARRLLGELVAEASASGAAVVLSSHEPDLSTAMADRVVTMAGGRVSEERRGARRASLSAVPAGESHVA